MIAGIYNASGSYIPNVEYFFMICALAGIIVGVYLNVFDRRYGNKLNRASSDEDEEDEILFGDTVREDGNEDFAHVDDDEYFSPLMT